LSGRMRQSSEQMNTGLPGPKGLYDAVLLVYGVGR